MTIVALLVGCAGAPRAPSEPPAFEPPASAPAAASPTATTPDLAAATLPTGTIVRPRSRWVPASWTDLPGWQQDRSGDLWAAFERGCQRPAAGWATVCGESRVDLRAATSDATTRAWLQQHLQPYRVVSNDGVGEGLITGYFEPLVSASRLAGGNYRVPLYAPPTDLGTRKPYWTRQQIDTLAAAQAGLRGRVLAYVADPLDALILQIQGSGRLQLTEADGSRKLVRVAYAGHNDQPYKSVGRWLIERGELRPEQASWPAIKTWAQLNPQRVDELLWSNPRVVFFREEALPDVQLGPKGAQAVPLTPGRSIAVDPQSIPYGTVVWIDTTEPLSNTPLRRAVMAQDTGSAITGAVRADYFWGWGAEAEAQAGRMKQPLRLWALWPKR